MPSAETDDLAVHTLAQFLLCPAAERIAQFPRAAGCGIPHRRARRSNRRRKQKDARSFVLLEIYRQLNRAADGRRDAEIGKKAEDHQRDRIIDVLLVCAQKGEELFVDHAFSPFVYWLARANSLAEKSSGTLCVTRCLLSYLYTHFSPHCQSGEEEEERKRRLLAAAGTPVRCAPHIFSRRSFAPGKTVIRLTREKSSGRTIPWEEKKRRAVSP